MTTWEKLKRRKIVQWTLAYLAGAWLVLDVTTLLGGHLGWAPWVHRALIVLAAVGLPIALVVAWYHGEKGRQRVGGVELAIVTALLVVAAVGVQRVRSNAEEATPGAAVAAPPAAAERSIAVLPLDHLGADPDTDHLAAAVTEEITSALSNVPGLAVTSRSSASQYPESDLTVREFARALGVAHVIEGSVQRADDRVRVTVQLIDAEEDRHLWTQTWDRELTGLFEVQVEVAREVAERLAATFTERDRERILAGATADPVAYDLFLRARALPSGSEERRALLRRAVERDPEYWPAWDALAGEYLMVDRRGGGPEWADSAREAFSRAVEATDDESARLRIEAFRARAFEGEADDAIARLRAAAERRPSDIQVVAALGELLQSEGRLPEAVHWRHQGTLLDPLNPHRWFGLWYPLYWLGLYERAEAVLDRGQELAPGEPLGWWLRAYQRLAEGRFEEGLEAADSLAAYGGGEGTRALALWFGGDAGAAAEAFPREPSGFDAIAPVLLPAAGFYFAAGDSARGMALLDRVRKEFEGRALDDYLAEEMVWPRLQLAAVQGDGDLAAERLADYVETGGRDWRWIERSPLFDGVREHAAFAAELAELRLQVEGMRRRVERAGPWSREAG